MKQSMSAGMAFLLAILLLFCLSACGGAGSDDSQSDGDADKTNESDSDRDTYIPPDRDQEENGEIEVEVEDGDLEFDTDYIDMEDELEDNQDGDSENDGDEETDTVETAEEDSDLYEAELPEEDLSEEAEEELEIDFSEDSSETETENPCEADDEIVLDQLPFSATRNTLNSGNSYSGESCFSYAMPGGDYTIGIELRKLDILEISVRPLEGTDLAIYVLDSCEESQPSCIEASDSNPAAGNEELIFRAAKDGTYYIVVDGRQASSGGEFEIDISLGSDNGVPPAQHCDSHIDCDAEFGAGFCIVKDRWEASFCTLECEEDDDCQGFESGCCMSVPELGGKFCHLAKYCGASGMTALPGEPCATANKPNTPLCNPAAGAEYCEADKNIPYCSHSCNNDSDCSDLAGGCCVKESHAAASGTCVPGNDCPHACTADVNIENNSLPLTITNKSTSSYDNRVSAHDCIFTGTPGREVIFGVALNAGETLRATLSNAATFDGVLYVTGGCGWTLAECKAFADDHGFGGGETLLFTAEDNGTYYLVVDSTNFQQSGSFRLNLQLVDNETDGDIDGNENDDSEDFVEEDIEDDGCNPLAVYSRDELVNSVSVSGNTSGSVNSFQTSGCGGNLQLGPDDYYAVQMLAGDTLHAWLKNTGIWDPSIAVYRDCAEGSCAKLTNNGLSAQDEYLTWTSNVNGTVYVVIDSPSPGSGGSGSYQLTLSLNEIVSDGDTDSDSGEVILCNSSDYTDIGTYGDLAGSGFTETSSTVGAGDHSQIKTSELNCLGTPTPGPDKIYAIQLQYQQQIEITLSDVGGDFDPLLYVSSLCGKPIICAEGTDEGGINEGEQIIFNAPGNGTYYIVVDGPRQDGGLYSSGSYTITITQYSGL